MPHLDDRARRAADAGRTRPTRSRRRSLRSLVDARDRGVPFALEHTNSLRVDVGFVHTLRDVVDLARRLDIGVCMEINACWAERGLGRHDRDGIDGIRLVQVSDFAVGTLSTPNRLVPGDGDIPLAPHPRPGARRRVQGCFDLELIGPASTTRATRPPAPGASRHSGRCLDRASAPVNRATIRARDRRLRGLRGRACARPGTLAVADAPRPRCRDDNVRLARALRADRRGVRRRSRREFEPARARGRGRNRGAPAAQARDLRRDALRGAARPAGYVDEIEAVEFGEIQVFVGDGFVVTCATGRPPRCAEVRADVEARPELLGTGPARCSRDSRPRRRRLLPGGATGSRTTSSEVEPEVFSERRRTTRSSGIYKLKREVIELHHAASPAASSRSTSSRPGTSRWIARATSARTSATCTTTSLRVRRRVERVPRSAHSVLERQPHPGRRPPERGHAQDLGVGRDRGRARRWSPASTA